jgi:hypothetical protein
VEGAIATQEPQLALVPMVASQPLTFVPSQLAKPGRQLIPHEPAMQTGVEFAGVAQTLPQVPQLVASVWVARQTPEQAVWPAGQAGVHVLATQDVVPPAGGTHTLPQLPQLLLSVVVARQVPPQFCCPAGQAGTHAPATQVTEPPTGAVQGMLQPPQWATVLVVLTSQPSPTVPLQLAKPELHVPIVQAELTQGVAAALARAGQTVPHPPQWLALLVVLTSQPSVRLSALQSAKPEAQAPVQRPPAQVAVTLLVEQAMPQPPHAVTVTLVSVSQPSVCRLLLQSARPAAQVPLHALAVQVRVAMPLLEQTVEHELQASGSVVRSRHEALVPVPQVLNEPHALWQAPDTHTRPPPQALAQAPQLFRSLLRLTSQPSVATPLQSAKPVLQVVTVQLPALQPATAFGRVQRRLQAPQLSALVLVLVSQPLATLPSQLPRPVEHAIAQTPPTQLAVPPVVEQRVPQALQLFTSVRMSVSQPLPEFASQSRRSPGQLAMEVVHAELLHTAEAPTGGAGQAVPQPPQFRRLPATMLVSQPSSGLLLQSRNPVAQVPITHRPFAQVAPAFANWQMLPQAPQLVAVVAVLVSQPLASVPSQLAKPVLQAARKQAPVRQPATPLVREQTVPQALQLFGSFGRSRQTPEQFVVGDAQVEVHMPPEQTVPAPQTMPQVPQLALSVWSARHVPVQLVCPDGQTQLRPEHEVPPVQTVPQAPQLALSVARSRQLPEQFVCVAAQVVAHAPRVPPIGTWQVWPATQMVPQAPQLRPSMLVFVSQPLSTLESQSAKPTLQVAMRHTPPLQADVALGSEQARLHAPQWVRLVCVSTSQPLVTLPSQLPRPVVQAMLHTPPAQLAVPPMFEQVLPQAPQLATSVRIVASQPSPVIALQSRRSLGQVRIESRHMPKVQTAVPPTGGVGQARSQPPQLLMSALRSRQVLPHRRWPGGHWIWQNATRAPPSPVKPASPAPASAPLAGRTQRSAAAQVVPQAPQFWSVVSSVQAPLQIACVGPEQLTHVFARHVAVPEQVPARPASIEVPPSPATEPEQHGWPGAPHATQTLDWQVRPALRQMVRAPVGAVATWGQQAAPMVPHGPASGSATSVGLSMAHALRSTAVSTAKPNEMDLITADDNRPPRRAVSLCGRVSVDRHRFWWSAPVLPYGPRPW